MIREDYVRTARAKGLNGRLVIACTRCPTRCCRSSRCRACCSGLVLAGSIPVERAFGTPGLGYAMFTAVSERDVFVMQNLVFLYAVVFVLLNILVDSSSPGSIPRIRYVSTPPDDRDLADRAIARPAASRTRSLLRGVAASFVRRAPLSAFWGCVAAGRSSSWRSPPPSSRPTSR